MEMYLWYTHVCLCIHTHLDIIHICTHTYTQICICTHICTHVHAQTCIHTYTCPDVYTHNCICTHICTQVHIYTQLYMYMHMSLHTHLYMYTHLCTHVHSFVHIHSTHICVCTCLWPHTRVHTHTAVCIHTHVSRPCLISSLPSACACFVVWAARWGLPSSVSGTACVEQWERPGGLSGAFRGGSCTFQKHPFGCIFGMVFWALSLCAVAIVGAQRGQVAMGANKVHLWARCHLLLHMYDLCFLLYCISVFLIFHLYKEMQKRNKNSTCVV